MKVLSTGFEGLLILESDVFEDSRGFFMESFNQALYKKHNLPSNFVQENQSHSLKNVIRGLHFQKPPHAQVKLVRVVYGSILDVVVDLRRDQPTYMKVHTIELSAENRQQLLVPAGFAHGFSVLNESAGVFYKCDQHYYPEAEAGIAYNDPYLKIDWKVPSGVEVVSAKDRGLPQLSSLEFSF